MRTSFLHWPQLLLANVSEHGADDRSTPGLQKHWLLTWVQSGRGSCETDGYSYTLAAGDLRLLPPACPSRLRGLDLPWHRIWCAFREGSQPAELLQWGRRLGPVRLLHVPEGPARDRLDNLVRTLLDCQLAPDVADRTNICLSLLRTILLLARSQDQQRSQVDDAQLLPALNAMHAHLQQPLALAGLADLCGLSSSRFSHRFQQALGTSPMRYLEGLRLEQARHLLGHGQEAIGAVAKRCGWTSQEHFARIFKARCGLSPREFRRAAWQSAR